jgi:hypothetical protein
MAIMNTLPPKSYTSNNKTVFPINVKQTQVTDLMTGKTRTQYEYQEAVVEGEVTRDKLIRAQLAAQYSIEDEIAMLNNKISDPVKYAAEYTTYQTVREKAKTNADVLKPPATSAVK